MAVKPSIVFWGNERLVSGLKSTKAPLLNGLLDAGYNIVAVVSHHTDTRSRSKRPLEVAQIAKAHNIPVFTPDRPIDIKQTLIELNADIAILSAYGRIIPQEIIDIFPLGIINLHPSLLPKYRGPTPIESAVLSGDNQTGVSIMSLTAGMDSGDIYGQESISIGDDETKFDLYEKLSKIGAKLLISLLPSIIDSSLKPIPQDESKATYCKLLDKQDGFLKPNEHTAIEAERQVRAYLGFPKTRYTLFNQPIIITKSHVSNNKETALDIKCSDGNYLSVDEIIGPTGKTMSASSFLNGYDKAS